MVRLSRRLSKGGFISIQLLLLAVFVGVFGVGLSIFVPLPEKVGELLHQAGAVAYKSLGDIFMPSDSRKLVAEIDLQNNPAINEELRPSNNKQDGSSPNKSFESAPPISQKDSQQKTQASASEDKKTNATSEKVAEDNVRIALLPCTFINSGSMNHKVIFNEIAWMGSPERSGETASQLSNNEWLELKNVSKDKVNLSGWRILDETEKFEIILSDSEELKAGQFYLLERTDDDSVSSVEADKIYSGALSNTGEWLRLFDRECNLVDEIDTKSGWPAGDNATKQTLERDADGLGWHTSTSPSGTPKAENSKPQQTSQAAQTSTAPYGLKYILGVSSQGTGSGLVTSTPPGIYCGLDCIEEYLSGTEVFLTATPSLNSSFEGWSGACKGKESCAITISSTISVSAVFKSLLPPQEASAPPQQTSPAGVNHLVIAEIQIAGASTTNDFIKIYNPLADQFNLKGYRLVKRTKTGTSDSHIKSWTADTFIPAGGYYLWANSGYTEISTPPDTTTGSSVADDNGVAIRFGPEDTGVIVDSVAWGGAQNTFVEGSAFPINPGANQVLKRKFVNGIIQDAENNVEDFLLQ